MKMQPLIRYFLLGFALLFLYFFVDPLQTGPSLVNAQTGIIDDGISPPGVIDDGISPPGVIDDGISPPGVIDDGITPPSCPVTSDQYPQCGGTTGLEDKDPTHTYMITRFTDCHGNIARPYQIQDLGDLGQCKQAAPSGPSCTPNEVSGTTQHCVGQQLCTFNIHHRADCSTYEGGAYGCQNSAQCGFTPPPAACFVGKACTCNGASAGSCDQCNGGWCNGGQCSSCSPQAAPPPPPPSPSAPRPECPAALISTYQGCISTQLCSFDVLRRSDCTTYESGAYGCVTSAQCGSTTAPICTPSSHQETSCVGGQLCTFTVTQRTDCSIRRSGPRNCFSATQCGFMPPVPPPPARSGPPGPPGPAGSPGPAGAPGTPGAAGAAGSVTQTVNVQREVVREVFVGGNVGVAPRVVTAQVQEVKELPRTGLPALAWAALALIPAGFRMRKLGNIKKDAQDNPNYLWENRQFQKG